MLLCKALCIRAASRSFRETTQHIQVFFCPIIRVQLDTTRKETKKIANKKEPFYHRICTNYRE